MNYSYNGVVLPKLPEWDKETYPYAVIGKVSNYPDVYILVMCENAPTYSSITGKVTLAMTSTNTALQIAKCEAPYSAWGEVGDWSYFKCDFWTDLYWTSHDILDEDGTVFLAATEPDESEPDCLTFVSTDPFTIAVNNAAKNWDGTLYYSTDATSWNEWDGTTTITSIEHDGKQKIFMRGIGNSVITGSTGSNGRWCLIGDDIRCLGNIENLLDHDKVTNGIHPVMGESCYYGMFYGCTSLTSAPELPATTLATSCCAYMFYGCTSLTSAPELHATTLAIDCYYCMFYGCASLTSAPALPATTLATRCYSKMFYGCTSLIVPPALPATTLAIRCYDCMFRDCTSLTSAPELPATTLVIDCYYGMFHSCTSLTSAPELPATTLATRCYYCMFYGCASLTSAPELPATTLASNCYSYMFKDCTKLKLSEVQTDKYTVSYRIPTAGTGIEGESSLQYMFRNTGGSFGLDGNGTPSINTVYYLDTGSNTGLDYDPEALLQGYLVGCRLRAMQLKPVVEPEYDVTFENGVLYIKKAPAVMVGSTLSFANSDINGGD